MIFIDNAGHRHILEYYKDYTNRIDMGSSNLDSEYSITPIGNQLSIKDNTGNHGPKLSTICWL